jgi:hypothetical protein
LWELRFARDGWAIESGQYQRSHAGRVPDWYQKEPTVNVADRFWLDSFFELSTCRHYGATAGPIPWNMIVEYGERKQLEPSMIDILLKVIRVLDLAWMDWKEEQRDRQTRAQSAAGRRAKAAKTR